MPPKKEISLLPSEEDINSTSARVVRWLTTAGRFVIVFTELIVISAFISRFWLDRTNSDLSEIIRQQKAILESTASFEQDYAQLQRRLKQIGKLYSTQPEYRTKLNTLVESTPEDITYSSLSISHNPSTNQVSAVVNLTAYQESSIVYFISNLIANPQISSVDIKTIEKKPNESKYNVNLTLVFAPNKT